jgi:hypothetical protein
MLVGVLHGGWHVSRQLVVQNRCDAIFSVFLMVDVVFCGIVGILFHS